MSEEQHASPFPDIEDIAINKKCCREGRQSVIAEIIAYAPPTSVTLSAWKKTVVQNIGVMTI